MARYWPSSFLPFMERDEVEANENANVKTKEANVQPSRPNKLGQLRICIWPKRELSPAGPTEEISSRQNGQI